MARGIYNSKIAIEKEQQQQQQQKQNNYTVIERVQE